MKKLNRISLLIVAVSCLMFALSACDNTNNNNNNSGDTYYTVTFDSQGGSSVESKQVKAGNPVAAPSSPTRENFDFDGWYRSADENATRWNFSTDRVNENLMLYAHWTAKQEEAPPAPSETLTFERNAAGTGFIVKGDSGQAANIVIPAEHDGQPVVAIEESAFAYSQHTSDILSVTIPDSVTEIGRNAFHNQKALVSVKIGTDSELKSIGSNAFSGCAALTSFYLPSECDLLGYDATPASFADEDWEFIDSFGEVFNNCGAIISFTVAEKNTAFASRGGHLVYIGELHNTAGNVILIRGVNSSQIPSGVTKIGKAAFRNAKITTLTIPKSITSIENYAISDSAISKVVYEGTSEEWDTLLKASSKYWNMGNENVEIICSDTEEINHILVAYFSATGTTKKIAGYISEITGGELYEIVPTQPYTQEDLAYGNSSCRANNEQNSSTARPAINGNVENMEEYDVIFLGYPIWWSKAPKIIYTFLESYEFASKIIIPFCTSGSSPINGSIAEIQALASDATWLSGERFSSGSTPRNVQTWLSGLTY